MARGPHRTLQQRVALPRLPLSDMEHDQRFSQGHRMIGPAQPVTYGSRSSRVGNAPMTECAKPASTDPRADGLCRGKSQHRRGKRIARQFVPTIDPFTAA